jgi:hypothetical protein
MHEGLDDKALATIEREHREGLTSQQILDLLNAAQIHITEATLRKYVQLGLLPRSVRAGRKGKHQGSQGFYPASVVRQIVRIREMMADDWTIEQIQKEFLFVRGDIEELERTLQKVFAAIEATAKARASEATGHAAIGELAGAKRIAEDLIEKLTSIESRLVARARLSRAKTGLVRSAFLTFP